MAAKLELAMQCPGCWSVSFNSEVPGQYWECDGCGEKLTVIDLRDGPERCLNVDRGSLEFVARLQPLGDIPERVRINGVRYDRTASQQPPEQEEGR